MSSLSTWFRGLKGKLLALVALPVLALSAVTYLSFNEIGGLGESVKKANLVRLPLATASGEMDIAMQGVMRQLWTAYAFDGDVTEKNKAIERARVKFKSFKTAQEQYLSFPRSDKMKEMYKPVEQNERAFAESFDEIAGLFGKHTKADNENGRQVMVTKLRSAVNAIDEALNDMAKARAELAKAEADREIEDSAQQKTLLFTVGLICCLAIVVFGFFLANTLSRVLTTVTEKLGGAGDQVTSAGAQLSASSQQVSAGSTEAASSLEETVSSLEELASMVKLNADNAKQAASLSGSSTKSAEEGETEIKNLIGSMKDISSSSKKIEEIINVIDDIAFQTNLLALNAAVEAARAGEQGKGFAVVAEAVRNLAQRSASAAKDITVLIKDSVTKIEHGTRTADASGNVLKNIVTSVKKVSDLNNEIASACAEQANGITQINKAMNELDSSTQQNASSAEEVAAASQEMSAQAVVLQTLVKELGTVIHGGSQEGGIRHSAPVASAPVHSARVVSQARTHKPRLVGHPGGASPRPAAHAERVLPLDGESSFKRVGTTEGF